MEHTLTRVPLSVMGPVTPGIYDLGPSSREQMFTFYSELKQ